MYVFVLLFLLSPPGLPLCFFVSCALTHKLLGYKFTCEDHSFQTRYLIFLHKAWEQTAPWVLVSLSGEAHSSGI